MRGDDDFSGERGITRRAALTGLAGLAMVVAAARLGAATLQGVLGKHFHEMSAEEIARLIARLEADARERYGRDVTIGNDPPIAGVEFAYALDLSRCIGCRRCVYACVKENNLSRRPEINWIRVLQIARERGTDVYESNAYYDPEKVPQEGFGYMPVQCQQCRNPPCVKSCPVKATWQEPDGIVVIDPDWCIGCRCCMSACPYGARHFNWADPEIPSDELNPQMHVLGNRPRRRGVVEKCTFCIQRTRKGLYPACVEICPVGARKFGNLRDPESEVRYVLEHNRVLVLKEELNTRPHFYYFY